MKNVLETFSLKGETALLTGGAGFYGKQIMEALAEAGAETYIASRNMENLKKVSENYENVIPLQLDLGDEISIRNVVETIITRSGKLDILINNAVTRCACGGWDLPQQDFDNSLHVNATSMFLLTRLAAEDMKKRKSGSIINIGSYMGLLGPNFSNYKGTHMYDNPSPIYFYEKGGMVNFTRFAASVLGKDNIRVNCINPGGLLPDTEKDRQPEEFIRQYSENTMLGRLANNTDLKGIIVFLASEASAYITGANISVDGGYTAK